MWTVFLISFNFIGKKNWHSDKKVKEIHEVNGGVRLKREAGVSFFLLTSYLCKYKLTQMIWQDISKICVDQGKKPQVLKA